MKSCPQHWKDTAGGFLNIVDCFLILFFPKHRGLGETGELWCFFPKP